VTKRNKATTTPKKSTKRKRKRPTYRLACYSCDRKDYDGVHYIPKTWIDVRRYQTLAASLGGISEGDHSRSAFDWHIHMG
jgi:hypothetical protein